MLLLVSLLSYSAFPQKFQTEIGYKLNNDFTTYYKDLKPFYYSGITYDIMVQHEKGEYLLGLRYMPFLNSVRPEIGYNYYLHHNADQKFNYFIHTTVFFNDYSYNNKMGYENYNYIREGIKPADYNSVKFQSFVHDMAFGLKMGLSRRLILNFIVGTGYFYAHRDFVEGDIFKQKTKESYWGIQYNFRFGLKFMIYETKKEEEEELEEGVN